MSDAKHIKEAIERTANVIQQKPSVGLKTKKATARMGKGLTCEMKTDNWTLTSDMYEAVGGSSAGPTPGDFVRMGVSSCLAIGYAMWFAREEVPYDDIQVELEGDLNHSGMLGLDDSVPPGPDEFRIQINIVSSAPRQEIERVMALADAHSPELDVMQKPIAMKRKLNLTAPGVPTRAAQ